MNYFRLKIKPQEVFKNKYQKETPLVEELQELENDFLINIDLDENDVNINFNIEEHDESDNIIICK